MSDWRAGLDAALLEWLKLRRPDAVSLVRWTDYAIDGGYCETCSYMTVEIDFEYLTESGQQRTYDHEGSFSAIISELAGAPAPDMTKAPPSQSG